MSLLIIYDITGKNFHNYLFLCELDTFENIVKILHLGPIIKCLINLIHGSKENYIIIFFHFFLMKCTLVVPLTNRDLTVAARVDLFTLPVTVRLRFPLQRLFECSQICSRFYSAFFHSFVVRPCRIIYWQTQTARFFRIYRYLTFFAKCMLCMYLLQLSG